MNIFFEIHQDLPREGPGDRESTRRALTFMTQCPANPRILDIGCGPGAQTLDLAEFTAGSITAVDTHRPFLAALSRRAAAAGKSGRITPLQMSMVNLGAAAESQDVLWSEGAIYIMGFETGLRAWRRFLKPGGYVAVTEISWLKPNPPTEILRFWREEYPGMGTVDENMRRAESAGYQVCGQFTLPESSWWDEYYTPLQARVHSLRAKFSGDNEAQKQLDENQLEMELYRRYSEWYGYVFYILQKPTAGKITG